jgi:hypothetical protein
MRDAGSREVAFVGVVGALAVGDGVDQLRYQEIEVGIALAVRMRRQVDRNAIDRGGEVRAVVEVEAAQEILVRLAVAAVLGNDQAGHRLEQLRRAQRRAVRQLFRQDETLAGRGDRADQRHSQRGDGDFLERHAARRLAGAERAGREHQAEAGEQTAGSLHPDSII